MITNPDRSSVIAEPESENITWSKSQKYQCIKPSWQRGVWGWWLRLGMRFETACPIGFTCPSDLFYLPWTNKKKLSLSKHVCYVSRVTSTHEIDEMILWGRRWYESCEGRRGDYFYMTLQTLYIRMIAVVDHSENLSSLRGILPSGSVVHGTSAEC